MGRFKGLRAGDESASRRPEPVRSQITSLSILILVSAALLVAGMILTDLVVGWAQF